MYTVWFTDPANIYSLVFTSRLRWNYLKSWYLLLFYWFIWLKKVVPFWDNPFAVICVPDLPLGFCQIPMKTATTIIFTCTITDGCMFRFCGRVSLHCFDVVASLVPPVRIRAHPRVWNGPGGIIRNIPPVRPQLTGSFDRYEERNCVNAFGIDPRTHAHAYTHPSSVVFAVATVTDVLRLRPVLRDVQIDGYFKSIDH